MNPPERCTQEWMKAVKTDTELKKDVVDELKWDLAVSADAVGVEVKGGVVTVTGHLDTFAEKVAVERAVRRVSGVHAIALEIDVMLTPLHRRSDTEIAGAAEHAIRWHAEVPAEKLRVTVDGGWLTLIGEVEWDFQHRAAYRAVQSLIGVVGVSNEIAIRQRTTPQDLVRRIEDALKRQAVREAHKLSIEVKGDCVTLRGRAHCWKEREAIEGAAWAAPGVRSVVSEMQVDAAPGA